MKHLVTEPLSGEGHALAILDIELSEIGEHTGAIEEVYDGRISGVIVRGACPEAMVRASTARLTDPGLATAWSFPNAGMSGGEIRVIGEAATPTFTAMAGPAIETYGAGARRHAEQMRAALGEADLLGDSVRGLMSGLFGGRPAAPPAFDDYTTWAPYSLRALDPGEQIYAHHDNHYGLRVFERMDAAFDRSTILSWFITLRAAERDGQLIAYGLWGSDPNPPMLPTRFLDTEALERGYARHVFDLRAGDLVVFDSGRHVHRVSPVAGDRPRLTLGGFLTLDRARTRLAFWS